MNRAIQLGGTLLVLLTMPVLRLDVIFLSRLTVLVGGSKLRPGNVVRGICALSVFHECLEICNIRIETQSNHHGLVVPWRLVGERVD